MDEEESPPEYVGSTPKTPEVSPSIKEGRLSVRPNVPPKPTPRKNKSPTNSYAATASVNNIVDSQNAPQQNASPGVEAISKDTKVEKEDKEFDTDHDLKNRSYYNAPPKRTPPTPSRPHTDGSQYSSRVSGGKKPSLINCGRSISSPLPVSPPTPSQLYGQLQHNETGLYDGIAKSLHCYWGNISRTETEEKLRHHPDGSYLIRDSTTPGAYTLAVRQSGQTKCLKIFATPDKKFGLKVKDCHFESIGALVQHYTDHSLAEFNKQLTTHLWYPVNRPCKGKINLYESLSVLANNGRALRQAKQQYLELTELQERANQQVEYAQMHRRALDLAKTLYGEMLQPPHTQDDLDELAGLDEARAKIMQKNDTLIMKRHASYVDQVENSQTLLKTSEASLTLTKHDLSEVIDTLLDREEQCELIKDQVLESGAVPELVNCLLDYDSSNANWDSSLWLMDMSRDEAEKLLAEREVGTFLIRRRHEAHLPFALSVVCNKGDGGRDVKHCMIYHPQGRGYGFSEPGAVFESVEELVSRHADISIKIYFPKIDTPLAYPLLAEDKSNRDSFGFKDDGNRC